MAVSPFPPLVTHNYKPPETLDCLAFIASPRVPSRDCWQVNEAWADSLLAWQGAVVVGLEVQAVELVGRDVAYCLACL